MPLHRFDGFQVGVTSDSSGTRGDINPGRRRSEFSLLREGEEHVSRDLRSIIITVPIRLACR